MKDGKPDSLSGYLQIDWAFMEARDELRRRGFSIELMNELRHRVTDRIDPWTKKHHMDVVNYLIYRYYCRSVEVHIESLAPERREAARAHWKRVLKPVRRPAPF